MPNMNPSEEIVRVMIEVRQNFAIFGNPVALILYWNSVKNLKVTKNVQKMNVEYT